MENFEQEVKAILAKYKDEVLAERWQEAIAFGEGMKARSYWIRDSEDVVNIVWLNSDGIRDITWDSPTGESMFNFLPLKNILTFEVHEKENIAQFLQVAGNFLIHVVVTGRRGDLWWVAENEESKQRLHAFFASVLGSYKKLFR
jgi:hypothetical protein